MMYPFFVSNDFSEENRRKKIDLYCAGNVCSPSVLSVLVSNVEDPVLLESSEWPELPSDKLKQIRDRSACMLKTVGQMPSLLLQGEVIVQDYVSCLKEPFGDYKQGLGVLRRMTNLGTVYYFANDIMVSKGGDISEMILNHSMNTPVVHKLSAKSIDMVPIFTNFIDALLGKMGDEIGGAIWTQLFGDKSQIDFKWLLEEFEKVVTKANNSQTINEQQGKLNGVMLHMGNYIAEKEHKSSKKYLRYILEMQLFEVDKVLGTLDCDEYRKYAMPVLVAAVQIKIFILQEMAMLNDDPSHSASVDVLLFTVDLYLEPFKRNLDMAREEGLNKRLAHISEVRSQSFGYMGVVATQFYYKDSYPKSACNPCFQNNKDPKIAAREAEDSRRNYYERVKRETANDIAGRLKDMVDAVALWELLKKNPLRKLK